MGVRVLQYFVAWFEDSSAPQISGTVFFPILSLFWCGSFPHYGTDAACDPVAEHRGFNRLPLLFGFPMYHANGYLLTVTFSFCFSSSRWMAQGEISNSLCIRFDSLK